MSIKLSEIINSVTDAETTARMSYDSTLAANISAAGTVPLGAVIAVVEYQNVSIPATETIDSRGFQLCDGANLAVGHALGTGQSGKVPNLSDGRYLRGSTVSGTVGGANTATIGSANLPTHTHAVGTLANAAEASHTHAVGTYANAAEAAHTHTKSGSVGAGSSHTHANTIAYGVGSSHSHGQYQFAHRHWMAPRGSGYQSVYHSHDPWKQGLFLPSSGSTWTLLSANSVTQGTATIPGTESTNHSHSWGGWWSQDSSAAVSGSMYGDGSGNTYSDSLGNYWAPGGTAHGSTGAEAAHTHTKSGSVSAEAAHTHSDTIAYGVGSSHNHTISGSSAAGASHNHTISGSTADGGFTNTAMSIEPQYLNVRYLIRVK
jgi:hypothetical protein